MKDSFLFPTFFVKKSEHSETFDPKYFHFLMKIPPGSTQLNGLFNSRISCCHQSQIWWCLHKEVQSLRFGNLKGIGVKSSSVVSKRKREEARGKKVRNKQELVDNKNAHKE